jgi:hypothetical protein
MADKPKISDADRRRNEEPLPEVRKKGQPRSKPGETWIPAGWDDRPRTAEQRHSEEGGK